ncbi:5'-methylthioadenosine/S-adenosylhomocysteine nucleosidase [[Brevibacterium] frigoritolerans]|uniref:adenosylhomocysteine nucleosidase n=1 Tax=Peribacillus frigoritolerans TaxID=450367 RepID=A0A941J738_9BACI|nr:5'-methylthioadenosine/S-adenosylhomocysteine nucleosidase [Peribacillus frigoritolerans]
MVISTEVRHHDVDVTILDMNTVKYLSCLQLLHRMKSFLQSQKKQQRNRGYTSGERVDRDGDSFMNDPDRVEFVRGKFSDLYAVEMEAAAIAQVAFQFKTPFVIIRSLSDIAGKESIFPLINS